eukprot:2116415-Amphidinium_carterae.1
MRRAQQPHQNNMCHQREAKTENSEVSSTKANTEEQGGTPAAATGIATEAGGQEDSVATRRNDEDDEPQLAPAEEEAGGIDAEVKKAIELLRAQGYEVGLQEKEAANITRHTLSLCVPIADSVNCTSAPQKGAISFPQVVDCVSSPHEDPTDDVAPCDAASLAPRPDIPGLIQALRLTSSRNGVKILLMGHIKTRGREFALHTIQEPDTTAYLQEYVSERVPELRQRPFALAVVEGRSSPWHIDSNPEVYIANPLRTPGVTLQVEGQEDIVLDRTFVAFNGMRTHRV